MTNVQLSVLSGIEFDLAPVPDDVWRPSPFHADGVHPATEDDIRGALVDLVGNGQSAAMVVQGATGSGKTHMLGTVREQIQSQGGYFFLLSLLGIKSFWDSTLLSILDGLARPSKGGQIQVQVLLRRLSSMVGLPRLARSAVMGDASVTREILDLFSDSLHDYAPQLGSECEQTLRALVLHAGSDYLQQDIGHAYMTSLPPNPEDAAAWGLRTEPRTAQSISGDLLDLLSLTGPCVLGIDQIDALAAHLAQPTHTLEDGLADQFAAIRRLADDLITLKGRTHRTLTVLTCLTTTWNVIHTHSDESFHQAFQQAAPLTRIPNAKLGQQIVAARLRAHYNGVGFTPPYPTWPIHPSAFVDSIETTPRRLLRAVHRHIRDCVNTGVIVELRTFNNATAQLEAASSSTSAGRPDELAHLDRWFAELKKNADTVSPLLAANEDILMPPLLGAALAAWVTEQGQEKQSYLLDPPPAGKPALHARLRQVLDDTNEDQAHWCFRSVATPHSVAALSRIRSASTAAGLDANTRKRRLFLIRNAPWNAGIKMAETLRAFTAAGGEVLPIDDEDMRIMSALKDLCAEDDPHLARWILSRRPTQDIRFLQHALASRPTSRPSDENHPSIVVGIEPDTGRLSTINVEDLRRHIAIFAGSGSGKTVFVRRLVEECALQGVSSIVLDPNNDLARLGDPWPTLPDNWGEGDRAKAEAYIENTDVVVWTPRLEAGRPLSFKPLPDFRSVIDDPDELNLAIDATVAMLATRAKVDGDFSKAVQGRAVLLEALRYFARKGGNDLRDFIDTLAVLPSGISMLSKAGKLAAEMADNLTAAMVTDQLFGGEGRAVDPGDLLTPSPGKAARISVISFIGLPSDDQRQSFVNQLQMALFTWTKEHPAGDHPLAGLFVMEEAQTLAPSHGMTPCTRSTLALVSQARKYGLGLVFATQAPRGLHNQIPSNAATQFFGLLNSPVQITAVKELAQAKASEVPDISRLTSGQFYASGNGTAFQRIHTPMCLSYHPKSPLTTEEVIARARKHRL